MVYFQTKNSNMGTLWRALKWTTLGYFMAIGNILRQFGIFNGHTINCWYFGLFFPILVYCITKCVATLI
jgi:hypothetical protein